MGGARGMVATHLLTGDATVDAEVAGLFRKGGGDRMHPPQKAAFIRSKQGSGARVMMVGMA